MQAASPPPLPRSAPPMAASKIDNIQSPTKPQAAARAKSTETGRKSITSLGSIGSVGPEQPNIVLRSPSPTSKSTAGQAPLPEIQITRTESNRSTVDEKWVKPEKMDEGNCKRASNVQHQKRKMKNFVHFSFVCV